MEGIEFMDSTFTLLEALSGTHAPEHIVATLVLSEVRYLGFDGHMHQGQLVVHRDVGQEVGEIFEELLAARFPIRSVIPIAAYGWNDEASMVANNSSAFNYRVIAGSDSLSNHAQGLAIDLNPALNPYHREGDVVQPPGATYDPLVPGTITEDGPVVRAFLARGWHWGGHWESHKDFQHFEKLPRVIS